MALKISEQGLASVPGRIWRSNWRRRFARHRLGMLSFVWILVVIAVSLIGPYFTQDPNIAVPAERLQPPSTEHWFGTDSIGRDVFARVLAGGRVSLAVTFGATTLTLALGMLTGMIAGYIGGLFDDIVSRLYDIIIAIPTIVFGIVIVMVFGGSVATVTWAISIGMMPRYGRLFRAGTLSIKTREFSQAAVSLGLPHSRIVLNHILPSIIVTIVVVATGSMGAVALSESALSFLGAGIELPNASWGNIIAGGQTFLQIAPWISVFPGLVLTSLSLAFSFTGDALRDVFDVAESEVMTGRR